MKEQLPIPPNEWLFKDDEDGYRNFYRAITMPTDATLLQECTNDEKLAWEELNKQEEPQTKVVE